ncbi:hypothetical protein E2C11_16515 [Streptomyces lavendulae]|nr:hypothetical protein [Streptomyces lavendulae]TXJ78609.1 hypothetical protein E2C11_16515 [Streptomyces lavendulae]
MSEPIDLLPFYRDDDRTRVRFVGGPCHGRTMLWATGEPPTAIQLPVDTGPLTVADLTAPPRPEPTSLYTPRLDAGGQPSRDDDGTLVYEHTGQ